MSTKRVNVLGVQISAVSMGNAIQQFDEWVQNQKKNYVCVTPAHSVMDCVNDASLCHIFNNSGMTTPDGMSLVWILKYKGYKHVERVAGSDLMLKVLAYSSKKGWKHYFYGGALGIPEKLKKYFEVAYPKIEIVGTYSPPFRELTSVEEKEIIDKINSTQPDIIWVGISSPKQERWMAKNSQALSASILVGVGAAFDFLSGEKKRAPLWMQKAGLEWLFRFLSEPKRLWSRYSQYPKFIMLVLFQSVGLWKSTTE